MSATSLTATAAATPAQVGSVNVTVANPDPGGVTTQPKAVTVKAGASPSPGSTITLKVTPSPVSVALNGSQPFTATVKNLKNTAMTGM